MVTSRPSAMIEAEDLWGVWCRVPVIVEGEPANFQTEREGLRRLHAVDSEGNTI